MKKDHDHYMKKAIALSKKGMESNAGGPFGAIVVRNGKIISKGFNKVTSTNDPTAHAEVTAIRKACKKLGKFQLDDCIIYTSCEPCPMCLGAIYWARPKMVFYACDRKDAAKIKFDDQFIYDEIGKNIDKRKIKFKQILREEANTIFKKWDQKKDKVKY
jgi:tRNA(Arg) A34 adenosine deaminase TadA